jgi:hypothetical protein
MRQERCRARAADLIDHRGSGKPLGWLPTPRRKLCYFGANPGPTGLSKAPSPRNETFSRGQDPKRLGPVAD